MTKPGEGCHDLSVLEATACSIPCVVSRVKSITESATHQHDSILVPFGDVDEFVRAISGLVADEGKRQHLWQNAIRTVTERFDLVSCVRQHEALYQKVLEDRLSYDDTNIAELLLSIVTADK